MWKVGRTTAFAVALVSASVGLSGCGQQFESAPPEQRSPTAPPALEQPQEGAVPSMTTEETREAGHPTFDNGTAVSEADAPCTASVLSGEFSSYKNPDGSPQVSPNGTEHGSITLTNNSSVACWVDGYGKLQFVGDTGPVQMQPTYELQPGPSRVTIAPGEYAAIYLSWYDVSSVGSCTSVQRVEVGLPNAPENPEEASDLQPVSAQTVDGKVFACGGQVNSSAVYES